MGAKKGYHPVNEFKLGHPAWNKGKKMPDSFRIKCSEGQKQLLSDLELKRLLLDRLKFVRSSPKRIESLKKFYASPESADIKEKLSNRAKGNKWWVNSLKMVDRRPTGIEQRLINLIKQNGLPFKYVGNGEIWIAGKCPDFINTNGKKQFIELFGTYWHSLFNAAERIEHFRQYGFSTLIIWEDELKNESRVIKKIKKFAKLEKK